MSYVFSRDGNAIIARGSGEVIRIEPYGDNIIRFRSSVIGRIVAEDWTLLPPKGVSDVEISIHSGGAVVRSGRLVAEIDSSGVVKYFSREGRSLLEELWIDYRVLNANLLKARNYRHVYGDLYRIELYFKSRDDEYTYGMGQYAYGYLNLKGCALELAHRNTQISIPFALFVRPSENIFYGFLWNNPSIGRVEFAKNWTMFSAEASKQIDYLVIYGDTLKR